MRSTMFIHFVHKNVKEFYIFLASCLWISTLKSGAQCFSISWQKRSKMILNLTVKKGAQMFMKFSVKKKCTMFYEFSGEKMQKYLYICQCRKVHKWASSDEQLCSISPFFSNSTNFYPYFFSPRRTLTCFPIQNRRTLP